MFKINNMINIKDIKVLGLIAAAILLIISVSINSCQRNRLIKVTTEKASLDTENALRKDQIKAYQDSLKSEVAKRVSYQTINKSLILQRDSIKRENKILRQQIANTPEWVNKLSPDSVYLFLDKIAYPYTGEKKFPFNEPQIKNIHSNFIQNMKLNQLVSGLDKQIINCEDRILNSEYIANSFKNSLVLCEKQNLNSNIIIKNLEDKNSIIQKDVNKQKRRVLFWRTTTFIGAAGIIILLL